jgi:N-acetyl-anhydromuramyl-L-alanine amidase AmpD
MVAHRTRVGLHARNAVLFPELDYELVRRARIETLKTLSFTEPSVYERIRQENPEIEFIVRLYDDRLQGGSHPSPGEFVAKMVPHVNRVKPYAVKFEIHNEPNHADGREGWGSSDQNAQDFSAWYMQVLTALKQACPWARFGFPGLALNHPHRDLVWLEICRDAIKASHWLGCHCYWQYGNMMSDQWGLRFKLYHDRFPKKRIEITEFGDSTPDRPREEIAQLYVRYYQELNKYPYLGSASAFLASSADPAWATFVWMKEGGEMQPVVQAVAKMERKPVEVVSEPEPEPVTERHFPKTGKTVRGKFLEFVERYGLDITGYPITDQLKEDGLPSQYFQRVGLEQQKSGAIRLKMVGSEAWTSRSKIAELQARVAELSQLPPTAGVAKPAMEELVDKLPKHPTERYPTRALTGIRQIVIHHTATSPIVTPQRLAHYQVKTLGKPGIVYHFVVAADGTLYQTNRLETVSDHAYSRNADSVGVCFPGNFTSRVPPAVQIEAGARLCAWLLTSLRLSTQKIVGLSEFVNSESPGKQWLEGERWKDMLLAKVEAALETGDPSVLITSLQERIQVLEQEIERLKGQAADNADAPAPTPAVEVAKPVVQNLVGKLATHPTRTYSTRRLADIQHLIIHHSAVAPTAGPQRIADYQVSKLDWPGIGYHYLVGEDGTLYQGNTLETVSYHAVQANPTGVGICFLGDFSEQVPPQAQLQAGAHLVAWLLQELGLSWDAVKGHQEVMDTRCPGDQWLKGKKWKEMLHQEITRVQERDGQLALAQELRRDLAQEAKPIYHYMLFWAHNGQCAEADLVNARNYIGTFGPTAGFSTKEAAQAQFVTIVGGPPGVSKKVAEWLKSAGCQVDRISGRDAVDLKRQLDALAEQKKRFRSLAV